MMKYAYLIAFLFFFLFCGLAVQQFFSTSYQCSKGCITGRPVEWSISITHEGQRGRGILGISIIDSISKEVVASSIKSNDTEEFAAIHNLSWDNESDGYIVKPDFGKKYAFSMRSRLPEPNVGRNFSYRVCLTRTVPRVTEWKLGSEATYCYLENYSVEMTECLIDSDCKYDEFCFNESCMKLNCTDKQYPRVHQCLSYNCTYDSDCRGDEVCAEHKCTQIKCENATESLNQTNITKYYLSNHTCSATPCQEGQIIEDFFCVEKECGADEYFLDYKCEKLQCRFEEGYANHSCEALGCTEGEGIIDHRCVRMECEVYEDIINYSCAPLKCSFLQKAESHECLIHTEVLIEVILLLLIGIFFILDMVKFKGKHRRKVVSILLRKAKERGSAADKKDSQKK